MTHAVNDVLLSVFSVHVYTSLTMHSFSAASVCVSVCE